MFSDELRRQDARRAAQRRRVYFGLRPDPAAAAQAVALAERLRHKHRLAVPTLPSPRLHVSLNGLPSPAHDQTIAKACEAVSALRLRSFVVAFNRVASFGGGRDRPVVLWGDEAVIGVEQLHAALHAALAKSGVLRGRPAAFEPHMTLIRADRELPAAYVEPVSWRVEELLLLASGDGRRAVLGRWPLA